MISLIYFIGFVISFFLIAYICHEDEGELDKEALWDVWVWALFSWLTVIVSICTLIYMKYIAELNIPYKIVKRLNKLFSKKNNHKEK